MLIQFIIYILIAKSSFKCSCLEVAQLSNREMNIEVYHQFDAIFIGTVESSFSIDDRGNNQIVLTVDETLKGTLETEVELTTYFRGSTCRVDDIERIGNKFILYCVINDRGELTTGACSGSRSISKLEKYDYALLQWKKELSFLRTISNQTNDQTSYYFSNGQVQSDGKLVNNIPVDKWVYYNYYGKKNWDGYYLNGKKDSIWTEYRYSTKYDQSIQQIISDSIKLFNHSTGSYKLGKKDAEWKTFNKENHHIYSAFYENGKFIKHEDYINRE